MSDVVVTSITNLQNEVSYRGHSFITDEPKEAGGDAAGPDPYIAIAGYIWQLHLNDCNVIRATQGLAAEES